MRFVFVLGGVFSGLGKGTITATIGRLLKESGLKVSLVKMDPYLNADSSTIAPSEHGEVYVTYDGKETDLDLGNYERLLGEPLPGKNNITGGWVFWRVLEKERKGMFGGKTVTWKAVYREIAEYLKSRAKKVDVLVAELGGTLGEEEQIPFLRAMKQVEREVGKENVLYVFAVYLPVPPHLGEMKTKPAQIAVSLLRANGINPDILVLRAPVEPDEERIRKIASAAMIPEDHVFPDPDLKVPEKLLLMFEERGLGKILRERFGGKKPDLSWWKERVERIENPKEFITVKLVGERVVLGRFQVPDTDLSIRSALRHITAETGIGFNLTYEGSADFCISVNRKAPEPAIIRTSGAEEYLGDRAIFVGELEEYYQKRIKEVEQLKLWTKSMYGNTPKPLAFERHANPGKVRGKILAYHINKRGKKIPELGLEKGTLWLAFVPEYSSRFGDPAPVYLYFLKEVAGIL